MPVSVYAVLGNGLLVTPKLPQTLFVVLLSEYVQMPTPLCL